MTSLRIIVARAANHVIGRQGELPWRLPADLAHFKRTTMGHPIIMGRKTWLSIGRPLPGRTNMIVSTTLAKAPAGCLLAASLDTALAQLAPAPFAYVIGGAALYAAALPRVDAIVLTEVEAVVDGDVTFDFPADEFRLDHSEKRDADSQHAHSMRFEHWSRRR